MDKCITAEGHIIGMLDRDQRTAKLRYLPFDNHVANLPPVSSTTLTPPPPSSSLLSNSNCHRQNNTIHHHHQTVTNINRVISHRNIPGRTSSHSSCKTRKNQQFWKSLLRLEHAFLFIIYFITFPTVLSAPVKTTDKVMSRSETPIWINPCGAPPPTTLDIGEEQAVPQSELISRIINQANIAISQAEKFASKFAQKGFSIDYYKDAPRYEWLPDMNEIPKKLGHQLSDDDFRDLQINETLINVYQYLQKFAVGIEQIVWDEDEQNVWDEKDQKDELTFKHLGGNLRNLLCEIQIAIYELRLKPKDDVSRDIMPDDLRKMDNTNTIMRNLLIFRDYMNAVEYIIQVFKYFQDKKT